MTKRSKNYFSKKKNEKKNKEWIISYVKQAYIAHRTKLN